MRAQCLVLYLVFVVVVVAAIAIHTLKNSMVEPVAIVPYCTSRCDTKSSTELIGVAMRSIVNSAAKLAVYDETRMNVKNHQTALTMRPDIECGDM